MARYSGARVILRDGEVPGVAVYSSGPDMAYVQAELLLLAERTAADPANAGKKIFGYYDVERRQVLDNWLRSYRKTPGDRQRLEDLHAEILRDGWHAALRARGGEYEEGIIEADE